MLFFQWNAEKETFGARWDKQIVLLFKSDEKCWSSDRQDTDVTMIRARKNSNSSHRLPSFLSLSLFLYKYVNTCKLLSSRLHHCVGKREKREERNGEEREREKNYYALFFPLLILKSSTTSIVRVYIDTRARVSLLTGKRRRKNQRERERVIITWLSISISSPQAAAAAAKNKAHGQYNNNESLSGTRCQCFRLSTAGIRCRWWKDALPRTVWERSVWKTS